MPTKLYLRVAAILAAATVGTILLVTWRANRHDTDQLTSDLAAAKQSLAQADARQHGRDKQLLQTLAALAAEKRNTTTSAQIALDLPRQIPLPSPITLQTKPQTIAAEPNTAGKQSPAPDQAVMPIEDLKPLYDFAIDCKACQVKLDAAQADLRDERAKAVLLTHERDEAVHVAKGGSVLRRIARDAKWLAIGALAGAVAAKAGR